MIKLIHPPPTSKMRKTRGGEIVMECKHPYYRYIDGRLICVQCGELSTRAGNIEDKRAAEPEDKIAGQHEVKTIWSAQAKRQKSSISGMAKKKSGGK